MDGNFALQYIDRLQKTTIARFDLARRLVAGRSRAAFLPDELQYHNFAGYVVATVLERQSIFVIQIRDAGTFALELSVDTVTEAERIFDELLGGWPTFGIALLQLLRSRGFREPDPHAPRSAHHFARRQGRG
jgi:hypothetical protein